jgi:oligoendopeptidase F
MKYINLFSLILIIMVQSVIIPAKSFSQMNRDEIDAAYKWNLKTLYESDDAWRKDLEKTLPIADELLKYRGKLGESASVLYEFLEKRSLMMKQMSRLSVYASLSSDQNTANTHFQGMKQELSQQFTAVSAKLSFVNPELSSIPEEKIDVFMKQEKRLEKYWQFFDNLFRQKKYILSDKEEKIVAEAGKISSAASSIYNIFSNAEMPFPTIELSDGTSAYLNQSGYGRFRTHPNQADREAVFKAFWETYGGFKNTFATKLYSNINSNIFAKNVRGYSSCLESALSRNNIPEEVYHSLIANVNKSLPAFHRYLNIKKSMLGVDTLKYSDTYISGVKGIDIRYDYETAMDLVLRSSELLGSEYASVMLHGFENNWVDAYPSRGKQSGAYSQGSAYDVHPFILMNYNDKYDDVSMLAHEFGHAMHSYFSNKTQDYVNARYSIFVAEVASTLQERLLDNLILDETKDDQIRLSLLMTILDGFRTTLFRQTKFAEFELRIHEEAEKGRPLTADVLNSIYKDLLYRYYGHSAGVCHIDDLYAVEWAFIPHFYYNFYVYQYSTSFTASMALSYDIINKTPGAVEKYIEFLSAGASKYPIDLLADTGVDMTSSGPFEKTIAAMNYYMDEVERILAKK